MAMARWWFAVACLALLREAAADGDGKKKLMRLNDENFEHETQAATGSTTGSWFVHFCAKHIKRCKAGRAALLKIDEELREEYIIPAYGMKEDSRWLWKRFEIEEVPITILFHKGWFYRYEGKDDPD